MLPDHVEIGGTYPNDQPASVSRPPYRLAHRGDDALAVPQGLAEHFAHAFEDDLRPDIGQILDVLFETGPSRTSHGRECLQLRRLLGLGFRETCFPPLP